MEQVQSVRLSFAIGASSTPFGLVDVLSHRDEGCDRRLPVAVLPRLSLPVIEELPLCVVVVDCVCEVVLLTIE